MSKGNDTVDKISLSGYGKRDASQKDAGQIQETFQRRWLKNLDWEEGGT